MSLNRILITLTVSTLLVSGASAQQMDILEPGVSPSAASAGGTAPSRASTDVPLGVSYQAVARNANGEILGNQPMGLRVSLVADSETGTVLYAETHSVSSDAFGVVSFVIGQGTPVAQTLQESDWDGQPLYVKLEADFSGGTTYTDLGASRIWSVPFAWYAANAFDPSVPRVINSDDGDSAIVTRISGNRTALAYENYITTNSPSAGGTFTHVTPDGTTPTFIYGTYSRVTGQNNAGNATGTGAYAGYNVSEGTSKIKMGAIGFAIGEGSGEIVPFGDPQEANGNFGSINYGLYGVARGNSNLNIGVFGRADGSVSGARGNVGVEAQGFVAGESWSIGLAASAGRSNVRNVGVISRVNGTTSGSNNGMEIIVDNASVENIGLLVNANGANAVAARLNGKLEVNGDIIHSGIITQSSDRDLKDGIAPLESTLSKLLAMNVVSYRYRQDTGLNLPTGTHYGVVAQELEPLFPELVRDNVARIPDADAAGAGPSAATAVLEYKSVNYTEMIPLLIKAMQEQQAQIEALKAEIERLKGE